MYIRLKEVEGRIDECSACMLSPVLIRVVTKTPKATDQSLSAGCRMQQKRSISQCLVSNAAMS